MNRKVVLVIIVIVFFVSIISYQGVSENLITDDTVRVGLCFGSSSTTYFKMAIYSGIFDIGYTKNGTFTKLFEYSSSEDIAITRDTYYHIKIGDSHEDYDSALKVKNEFRNQDYLAYLAYTGKWEVWIGNFSVNDNGLLKAQEFIKNSMDGKFSYSTTILEPSDYGIVILKGTDKLFTLKLSGTSLRINTRNGTKSGIAWLNGKRYRGNFEISRITNSDMTVVNVLSVEDYLYGVIPYEMLSMSPMEALKAQAVAARTYALTYQGKSGSYGFELYDDTRSQVYKGFDGEQTTTNQAVNETKGQVLVYSGKLAQTYFFSSSGGMTEDNVYVWSNAIFPYLTNVPDLYESGESYNYSWEYVFNQNEIIDKLSSRGLNVGNILGMEVKKWTPAGRPYELVIEGSAGDVTLSKTQCRTYFNLPSQWYNIESSRHYYLEDGFNRTVTIMPENNYAINSSEVKKLNDNLKVMDSSGNIKSLNTVGTPTQYRLIGKGWGHGIGLSQEGAKGMAFSGFTYDEILSHYYPGTLLQ